MPEALRDFVLLKTTSPVGIKPMKQIELVRKWRTPMPRHFANILFPYPGDTVMKLFNEEQNRKARERMARRKESGRDKKKQKMQ